MLPTWSLSLTEGQHGRDQDVSSQTEEQEHNVSDGAEADINDFEESVGVGSVELELGGELGEEEDLDGGTGGIPIRARDSVTVRNGTGLQQCRSPCPGRDDTGGDKTGFDATRSGSEFFGIGW